MGGLTVGDAAGGVDNTASMSGVLTGATGAVTDQGLMAEIINLLGSVSKDIEQAVARTKSWNEQTHEQQGHHHGDRYVMGDTNWEAYATPDLVSMVGLPASPPQVQSVAALWRNNGSAITQSAENLSQSLTALMNYWQGSASQMVSDSVANTSKWISAVGETSAKVADQIENAAGALQSAQNTMPGMPASNFWVAYNTAAGGATVGAPAGPFGVAAGTMMGGIQSVFAANANQGAEKQQAVQTMQRFEQAAVNIDTTTPQFIPPPAWGNAAASTPRATGPGMAVTVPNTQLQGAIGAGLTTVPSFAVSPAGRWDALTGGAVGGRLGAIGAGGPGGGSFAGGLAMFGGGLGGRSGVDAQRAANTSAPGAVAATGENPAGVVGRGAAADGSIMEAVDGARAGGGGAMPMGGGMMGAGAGGRGSDQEHQRRIPFEDNPFITGMRAVPPVIGLNATDQEADQ